MNSKKTTLMRSVVIHRTIGEVWSFLTDFHNLPKWDEGVIEIREISPGPIGVGSTVVDIGRGLGRRWVESFRVVEFNPNHAMTLSWTGSYGEARVRYIVEPAPDGTKLSGSTDGAYRFPYTLLLPLLGQVARKNFQADLDHIKRILEEGTSSVLLSPSGLL